MRGCIYVQPEGKGGIREQREVTLFLPGFAGTPGGWSAHYSGLCEKCDHNRLQFLKNGNARKKVCQNDRNH